MPTLADIAHLAMIERGFIPEFPPPVLKELSSIQSPAPQDSARDMRSLLWISIDNDDSRDLDQLTFAEKNKIYIAVADVDALVKSRSAINGYAAHNTTSVYTPAIIFPMLPPKLSTDLTSLNENTDRKAMVIEVDIGDDGSFNLSDIYPAYVRNHAKLAYNAVSSWLEEKAPFPPLKGLKEQLQLQDKIAQAIKNYRSKEGALYFETIDLEAVIVSGKVVGLEQRAYNRAHELIENFMIAANVAATRYLMKNHRPSIRRIVKTPKRWDRIVSLAKVHGDHLPSKPDAKALREFLLKQQRQDPDHFPDLSLAVIKLLGRGEYVVGLPGKESEGHFDLALRDYTHATAPNRRYPDLIMQRLLKGQSYRDMELRSLAAWCTQKEADATKVERRVRKSAAAMALSSKIGAKFQAMVTGAGPKGTWVRLFDPPIEGKLTHGFKGLDVGDYVTVQLTHVDIVSGHIDFTRSAP